ncbi:hypothetical protein ACFSM5_19440 [Lacibacterium aquatile]|uniref:Uncharacterized protein n=1 Tax=Lacibacterium aquatile TaxID=1168082 RepID=A0ABW5DW52_9PROT
MTPRPLLYSFLLSALVLGLLNSHGLVKWSRDVHPTWLADRLLPVAEVWDGWMVGLGADTPYIYVRGLLADLRGAN